MIIVKIWGGLGNQMFQYAAATALAIKHNQQPTVDLSFYENVQDRSFSLGVFPEKYQHAAKEDIASVLGMLNRKAFFRGYKALSRLINIPPLFKKYLDDPHFVYNKRFEVIGDDCFMDGYWQSYKYFDQYRPQILKLYSFKEPAPVPSEILEGIRNNNSVSIHIRRGDYISDKKNTAYHGVCDISYYKEAIEYIKRHVEDPVFYLFSDDIEWVQENLKLEDKHFFISEINKIAEVDMQLMSLCRHNIIANSSFSWWGAWLNNSGSKIVIAPKKWFAANIDTRDLIPADWIRL